MSQIEEDSLSDELARVRVSFTEAAEAYRLGAVFSNPADLARMLEGLALSPGDRALDVGSGGGHTAVALATAGARTTALDVTPAMLRETKTLAAEKGTSLECRMLGDAHTLPFAKRSFDAVTTRFAAHHFGSAPVAVREMARVLKPGGRLYVFDLSGPDEPEMAAWLDGLEKLRDSSHVASHPPSRWRRMIESVGLEAKNFRWSPRPPYDMASWLDRSGTPEGARAEIQARLANAPTAARKHYHVEEGPAGWRFASPAVEILAVKH